MPEVLEIQEQRETGTSVTVPASPFLAGKLTGLRRRHLSVAVMTGLAIAVSVSIELLALELFADWWLELPWKVRLVLLVLQIGALAYILVRLVAVPLLRQPDDDDVALMVEKARPIFRSRLIASLQLARPGAVPPTASKGLALATIEETERVARSTDFASIVSTERLKKVSAVCG